MLSIACYVVGFNLQYSSKSHFVPPTTLDKATHATIGKLRLSISGGCWSSVFAMMQARKGRHLTQLFIPFNRASLYLHHMKRTSPTVLAS